MQKLPETERSVWLWLPGKGVEPSSPNYFWKKPLLKDLEQEEKVSSRSKVMVVSLSLPIPRPLCTLTLDGAVKTQILSPLPPSFPVSAIPSCVPILAAVGPCVAVFCDGTLGQFRLK